MKTVIVHNLTRPTSTAIQAGYGASFMARLRGLMFRRRLPAGQGLLLVYGRDSRMDASIHMLGMFFDLAVVWINDAMQVVDVRLARRGRPAYFPVRPARYVLELPVDHLPDFVIGDQVQFEHAESV